MQRNKFVFVDPKEESPVPYRMDEGRLFGLGFFETILIRDEPYFLEEHLHRLNQSLERFGMDRSVSAQMVEEVIRAKALKNTALKLIVTEKNLFASVRPIPYNEHSYQMGKRVTISRVTKSQHSQIAGHKTLNYAENMLELRGANKAGYDDCLFLNEKGHLTESALANVFVVVKGALVTPTLSDGLLPGIIRQKVMEHFNVCEDHVSQEQLASCEGAFLTNSLVGAMPISQVEEVNVPRHPLCDAVIRFFGEMIPQNP